MAASTQNQTLNAQVFFYRVVLEAPLGEIDAARVRRPATVRPALSVEETVALPVMLEKSRPAWLFPRVRPGSFRRKPPTQSPRAGPA